MSEKLLVDVAVFRMRNDGGAANEVIPPCEVIIGGDDASLAANLRALRALWANVEAELAKQGQV
jgi:hypothetical protein